MPDKNFFSFNGRVGYMANLIIDPPTDTVWSDPLKFSHVTDSAFDDIVVLRPGVEDGVDINNFCKRNIFRRFTVPCGKQALTLKGGSCDNILIDWLIKGRGKFVELEFGNWSDQSQGVCTGNIIERVRCEDGKPVRYAGRFGCLPKFKDSKVRHVWWLSIGITVYYWGKYSARSLGKLFRLVTGNNQ